SASFDEAARARSAPSSAMEIVATSEETLKVRAFFAHVRNRPPAIKEVVAEMGNEPAPEGTNLPGFPILTSMTGGLQGLWIIGGVTGTGKSTLAMNIVA